MSTDEYVPDEMDARGCFLDGAAGAFVTEDWEAFLARVRRDAAREALAAMEEEHAEKAEKARVGGNPTMHSIELVVAEAARQHRDTRHAIPEETP